MSSKPARASPSRSPQDSYLPEHLALGALSGSDIKHTNW